MLTLTAKHSSDLDAARRELTRSWNVVRGWLRRRTGLRLRYLWVVECTRGRLGRGHVHMHVVIMLPYVDYDDLRDAWERATTRRRHRERSAIEPSRVIDVSRARQYGARKLAEYLAKYVSKGVDGLRGDTAVRWWCATYYRRALSGARGVLSPLARHVPRTCRDCGGWVDPVALVEFPAAAVRYHADWCDCCGPPRSFRPRGPHLGPRVDVLLESPRVELRSWGSLRMAPLPWRPTPWRPTTWRPEQARLPVNGLTDPWRDRIV